MLAHELHDSYPVLDGDHEDVKGVVSLKDLILTLDEPSQRILKSRTTRPVDTESSHTAGMVMRDSSHIGRARLILLNGLFSMSETALISARKSRLSSEADR